MPIRVDRGTFIARFEEEILAKRAGTAIGLEEGAQVMVDQITHRLSILSHTKGTATPSAPGQPPARVSGDLGGSIEKGTPEMSLMGGRVKIQTDVIYSAIQEYGGASGRNLATVLPARPFMVPGLKASEPLVLVVFARAWS